MPAERGTPGQSVELTLGIFLILKFDYPGRNER